uniref:Uncharacterized protein n=1 Tax=Colobus angolensis palliatus TaxID=336983 RepID=A0A2K5IJJ1_COLAP
MKQQTQRIPRPLLKRGMKRVSREAAGALLAAGSGAGLQESSSAVGRSSIRRRPGLCIGFLFPNEEDRVIDAFSPGRLRKVAKCTLLSELLRSPPTFGFCSSKNSLSTATSFISLRQPATRSLVLTLAQWPRADTKPGVTAGQWGQWASPPTRVAKALTRSLLHRQHIHVRSWKGAWPAHLCPDRWKSDDASSSLPCPCREQAL